jgi:hypothetical protein
VPSINQENNHQKACTISHFKMEIVTWYITRCNSQSVVLNLNTTMVCIYHKIEDLVVDPISNAYLKSGRNYCNYHKHYCASFISEMFAFLIHCIGGALKLKLSFYKWDSRGKGNLESQSVK